MGNAWRRAISLLVGAGLAVAVLSSCSSGPVPRVVAERSPLPELRGQSLSGPSVEPSFYQGRVLVVNFWASWCGPCLAEQPALEQVYRQYQAEGVRFVGVNWRDQTAAAKAWIRRFAVSYPNIFDPSGALGASFAIAGAPDTFIVDRTGTIRWAVFGATSATEFSGLIQRVLEPARS
jgi:DsbE subfamily thiol:disulfide oxidoreductase